MVFKNINKFLKNKENRKLVLIVLTFYLFVSLILIIQSVSAVGTYPDVDPHMVLYYHFNNDSSVGESYGIDNVTYDYSGNGNNGTYFVNTTFDATGGYLGDGALRFNGNVNSWVNTTLTIPNDINFTISGWIYMNKSSAYDTLVAQYKSGEDGRFLFGFNNNKLYYRLGDESRLSSIIYSNDTWYYLTLTYDMINVSIYLNGDYVMGDNVDITKPIYQGLTSRIGRLETNYLNGSIDDVIIYNRSLNSNEVWNNYMGYVDCLNLTDSQLSIGGNTILCNGDYLNNGSSTGAIKVNSNNIILDCNSSGIKGNYTSASLYGIYGSNVNNITIKNCNLSNYYNSIRFTGSDNIILQNITISDSFGNLRILNSNNVSILNSTMINSTTVEGIYITDSNNINISNTIFNSTQIGGTSYGIYYSNVSNSFISNVFFDNGLIQSYKSDKLIIMNIIKDYAYKKINTHIIYGNNNTNLFITNISISNVNGTYASKGDVIRLFGFASNNNTIEYNSFRNTYMYHDIGLYQQSNSTVRYNNHSNHDVAINIIGCYNVSAYRNNINLSVYNFDVYNTAFKLEEDGANTDFRNNFIYLYNNTLTNMGQSGFQIRGSDNVELYNNNISFLNRIDYLNYKGVDRGEPPCVYKILELFQTWTGDSEEVATDNFTKIHTYNSSNISIHNNTYGSNVQCFVHEQGVINMTINEPWYNTNDFWFVRYQLPYWTDIETIYINNSYEGLTLKKNTTTLSNYTYQGYMNKFFTQNLFNKKYLYFINLNGTYTNQTNLFNLSSPLISLSNGTGIFQSGSNLEYNFSLSPNNYTHVLEDFNCSESLQNSNGFPCGRENSPIWINYSQDNKIHIQSNLTNLVNIPFEISNTGRIFNQNGTNYDSYPSASYQNITIYPGENKLGIDCIEPFDYLVAQENMSSCNGTFSINQLSIGNSSRFILNAGANLTTDKLILYSPFNRFVKNGGKLIIT